MKKSNLLLLTFYLTLVFCFVVYLVGARNYIDHHMANGKDANDLNAPKWVEIELPVNHLVVSCSLDLRNVEIGRGTNMQYYYYSSDDRTNGYKLVSDTLFIDGNLSVMRLRLANKLKSIRFENTSAEFSTDLLVNNAGIYLYNAHDFYDNTIYCDGNQFGSLNLFLVNSSISMNQPRTDYAMHMDTIRVNLSNSKFNLLPCPQLSIGAFEVNSYSPADRISVPTAYLDQIKLAKHHYSDQIEFDK